MANNGKRDALGVIFLFAAIILGLIYVIPDKYTGVFGSFLRSVGFGLFGSIAIILPSLSMPALNFSLRRETVYLQ